MVLKTSVAVLNEENAAEIVFLYFCSLSVKLDACLSNFISQEMLRWPLLFDWQCSSNIVNILI